MHEPSKDQLLEAGVLPNWNKNKDPTDVLSEGQRQTWRSDKVQTKKPKPHGVGGQSSRQKDVSRRADEPVRRPDSSKAVSVFGDRSQPKQGGRRNVAFTAVLDRSEAPTEGASYRSSTTGASASRGSAAVNEESMQ